jgi:hypothetical protein
MNEDSNCLESEQPMQHKNEEYTCAVQVHRQFLVNGVLILRKA